MATNKGVKILKIENNSLKLVRSFLDNLFITDLIFDSEGNLWLTSLNDGIRIVPNLDLLKSFQLLNNNNIRNIYPGSPNKLYVFGDENKIYGLNTFNSDIDTLAIPEVENYKYFFYNKYDSLYYLKTLSSLKSYEINKKVKFKKTFKSFLIKDHDFVNADTVLFATNVDFKIALHDKNSDIKTLFNESSRSYTCLYNSTYKTSLFGTVKGLIQVDKNFNRTEITHKKKSIFIKDMVVSPDGTVWALSFKNGFYQIIDSKVVNHINESNGLLTNINSFIRFDTLNNKVYILGEKGLQVYNLNTTSFLNITKKMVCLLMILQALKL
jgi:ligand-binding sensor domain-containing protein